MGHEDDKNTEHDGAETEPVEEGQTEETKDSDLFTSAEYDLRLLSKSAPPAESPTEMGPTEQTTEMDVPDEASAQGSQNSDGEAQVSTDGTGQTEPEGKRAPWDQKPDQRTENHQQFQRNDPELQELVDQDEARKRAQKRRDKGVEPAKRVLPGKDTQSVVVNMDQLNEEAEKAIQEKAAQRAAFSPLESSGAMERITFSNLEALNLPKEEDDPDDMAYDNTIDSNQEELDFGTADEFDELERPPRRPGRVLFLLIVSALSFLSLAIGWAVYNLGEHRSLLMKKPVEALEIGWGIQEPPRKVTPPKAPINQLKTVSGSLKIDLVQIDWGKKNRAALVSGELINESNAKRGRIELSIELFDEMTKSMIVRRVKCCQQEALEKVPKQGTTPDMPRTADTASANTVLAPGERTRFSARLDIKKPKRGEVTQKVRVYYSEVID